MLKIISDIVRGYSAYSEFIHTSTILCLSKEGLLPLVEYNEKKLFEVKLKEMKSALTSQLAEEADISEVIETVKQHVKDAKFPDIEVVRILWDVMMDAVQWSGKNQQQNSNSALRQVWPNCLGLMWF